MKRACLSALMLFSISVLTCQTRASTSADASGDQTELYAQLLVDQTAAEHPEIRLIGFHAVPPGQSGSRIIASTVKSKLGKKSDPDDLEAMTTPHANPLGDTKYAKDIVDCGLAMKTNTGKVVGMMVIEIKYSYSKDPAVALKRATEIRDELATRIGSLNHLFSSYYPVDRRDIHAQQLVTQALARHPELNKMSLHAVPPGHTGNRIIASGQPMKLGKEDDPDDTKAMTKPFVNYLDDVGVVDCGIPLEDSSGHVIGTMVTQVKYSYTKDKAAAFKHASDVRDELKAKIASAEDLFSDPHD